jgi:transcriptional regulator with XRE-family HTH domain
MSQLADTITATERMGQRLCRLRKERRLTPSALAKRSGVTTTEIQDLEAGRVTDPELLVGVRLAAALCVDAEYLAFGTRLDMLPL